MPFTGYGMQVVSKEKIKQMNYDMTKSGKCEPHNTKCQEDALKIQEGGSHYKNFKIQPIEFIEANDIGFLEGNVIKYITRYKHKNGLEDLKKAKHYIDLLIQLKYGEGDERKPGS